MLSVFGHQTLVSWDLTTEAWNLTPSARLVEEKNCKVFSKPLNTLPLPGSPCHLTEQCTAKLKASAGAGTVLLAAVLGAG